MKKGRVIFIPGCWSRIRDIIKDVNNISKYMYSVINKTEIDIIVGCIEDLRRFKIAVFQQYRDLEAGDNQSLKFKWRYQESNPGPLAPQAKSLTTRPPPLLN